MIRKTLIILVGVGVLAAVSDWRAFEERTAVTVEPLIDWLPEEAADDKQENESTGHLWFAGPAIDSPSEGPEDDAVKTVPAELKFEPRNTRSDTTSEFGLQQLDAALQELQVEAREVEREIHEVERSQVASGNEIGGTGSGGDQPAADDRGQRKLALLLERRKLLNEQIARVQELRSRLPNR